VPSLHVAMQMGPSHHPLWVSGVWSLRGQATSLVADFPADCPHRSRCHCRWCGE